MEVAASFLRSRYSTPAGVSSDAAACSRVMI
jgi:hypothetical protein